MPIGERTGSRADRPYRAPPEGSPPEDLRRALDRTNERINALLTRIAYLEKILDDNGYWVDP